MVAEQELFSLAMTTLQQEDLDNLRSELIGRIQIAKDEEQGFQIAIQQEVEEIRDTLAQGGGVEQRLLNVEQFLERMPDPDQFFEHMFTMETKLQEALNNVQQQMTHMEGDLAEVKSRETSHTHAPLGLCVDWTTSHPTQGV